LTEVGTDQGPRPIDPSVTTQLVRDLSELRNGNSISQLTPRQLEVLKLVAEGNRYKRIAWTCMWARWPFTGKCRRYLTG